MSAESPQPYGHPLTAAAVVGSFALAVGLVVRLSAALEAAEERLLGAYRRAGFSLEEGASQPWWGLLVLLAVVYAVALLLLEVPGTSRRVMLAATFLVLLAAASPVLAVWGVFWSPLVALVAGACSVLCATLWASHHPMPCERAEQPGAGKVLSIVKEESGSGEDEKREKRG